MSRLSPLFKNHSPICSSFVFFFFFFLVFFQLAAPDNRPGYQMFLVCPNVTPYVFGLVDVLASMRCFPLSSLPQTHHCGSLFKGLLFPGDPSVKEFFFLAD